MANCVVLEEYEQWLVLSICEQLLVFVNSRILAKRAIASIRGRVIRASHHSAHFNEQMLESCASEASIRPARQSRRTSASACDRGGNARERLSDASFNREFSIAG